MYIYIYIYIYINVPELEPLRLSDHVQQLRQKRAAAGRRLQDGRWGVGHYTILP